MDPLAALQAEIKKRKAAQAASKNPARKWRTQAEIEREREENYYKRQRELNEQRQVAKRRRWNESQPASASTAKQSSKEAPKPSSSTTATEEQSAKTSAFADLASSSAEQAYAYGEGFSDEEDPYAIDDDRDEPDEKAHPPSTKSTKPPPPLGEEDVIRKLRALKQPATMYGEDEWARFNRLREMKLSTDDQSHGQENKYHNKVREGQAKDATEDAKLNINENDETKNTKTSSEGKSSQSQGTGKGSTSDGAATSPTATQIGDDVDEADLATKSKEDYVHSLIRKYMRLWYGEVEGMSEDQRRSKKGRSELGTFEQTKEWLKPLQKLLCKRKLTRTILNALVEIFQAAAQREYMQAMRLYLERLAIGNAPWPMGATQVGIHSRAAREKIGEDKIAHVMNDEQTRKYIQAVKRLITVAQRHFPTDLSKSAST